MMKNTVIHAFNAFDRWTGRIDNAVKIVISTLMLVMFGLLLLNVLSRYVIMRPFFWLAEGAGYAMAIVGLFGSSSCIRAGAHMQVNLIPKRLSGPTGQSRRGLVLTIKISALALVTVYALVMIRYGYQFAAMGRFERSPSGFFIVFWPRLSLPIGGALIALQTLNLIARHIVKAITHTADPFPEDE